jgi:hypothetical protein
MNFFQKLLSFFGLRGASAQATTPEIEAAITTVENDANQLLTVATNLETNASALAAIYPPAAGVVATITALTAGLKTALTTAEALITSIENTPGVAAPAAPVAQAQATPTPTPTPH